MLQLVVVTLLASNCFPNLYNKNVSLQVPVQGSTPASAAAAPWRCLSSCGLEGRFSSYRLHYWNCNFPMKAHDRLLVGWLVGRSVVLVFKSSVYQKCSERSM